jgi:lipopolysaccharide export system protein LptC
VNRLAAIHDAEPYREPPAFVAARRRTTANAFRAARRHSRLVRVLRVGLPILVALAIAVAMLASWLNPLRLITQLPVGLRDVVISGTKIKMEAPRLSGYTSDARAYDLSALSAAQDIRRPEMIELTKLKAKIQMHDRSQVEIFAATGLFNTKSEILNLEEDILVTSSSGYEGRLTQAVINTRTGNIVSEKPVALKMLNGTINANAMEIEQAGDIVRFDRGVSMLLRPNKDQGKPTGEGTPQ